MPLTEVTLFLGSGLSVPAPSAMPLFPAVRAAIFRDLGVPGPEELACESMLWLLQNSGLDVTRLLSGLFAGGIWNAGHDVAARALAAGASVWTTNADELIEQAGGTSASDQRVAGLHAVTPEALGRLVKPHGTISRVETLAFQAPEVLAAPPAPLIERLRNDCLARTVILCGYSAVDPDLGPVLLDALTLAREVHWWELPGAPAASLRARLGPKLATSVLEDERPVAALVADLVSRECPTPSSSSIAALAEPSHPREIAVPLKLMLAAAPGSAHLAAGQLLAAVGRLDEADHRWLLAARRGGPRTSAKAALLLAADGLYRGRPMLRPIRIGIAVLASIPGLSRIHGIRKVVSVHAGLLEKEGRFEESLQVAQRRLPNAGPRELLDVAATARKAGKLELAVASAQRASQLTTGGQADGPLRCRALFEVAFTSRWRGEFRNAATAVREFERVRIYGGPAWASWWAFEAACLSSVSDQFGVNVGPLLPNDQDPAAALELAAARFRASIGSSLEAGEHRALQADCARVAVLRGLGDVARASDLVERIWRKRRQLARRSLFEDQALLVERASLALGDSRRAWGLRALQELDHAQCPVHRVLAALALADAHAELDLEQAWRAIRLSEAVGFGAGAVQGLALLVDAGVLEPAKALHRARASAPDIAGAAKTLAAARPFVFP